MSCGVLDGAALLEGVPFLPFTRLFGVAFAATGVGVGFDEVELLVLGFDLSPVRLPLDALLVEGLLVEAEEMNI